MSEDEILQRQERRETSRVRRLEQYKLNYLNMKKLGFTWATRHIYKQIMRKQRDDERKHKAALAQLLAQQAAENLLNQVATVKVKRTRRYLKPLLPKRIPVPKECPHCQNMITERAFILHVSDFKTTGQCPGIRKVIKLELRTCKYCDRQYDSKN